MFLVVLICSYEAAPNSLACIIRREAKTNYIELFLLRINSSLIQAFRPGSTTLHIRQGCEVPVPGLTPRPIPPHDRGTSRVSQRGAFIGVPRSPRSTPRLFLVVFFLGSFLRYSASHVACLQPFDQAPAIKRIPPIPGSDRQASRQCQTGSLPASPARQACCLPQSRTVLHFRCTSGPRRNSPPQLL